jgi:hypothetical protein
MEAGPISIFVRAIVRAERMAAAKSKEDAAQLKAAVDQMAEKAAFAELRAQEFFRFIDMGIDEWTSISKSVPSVGTVLGVGDDFITAMLKLNPGNGTLGWDGLRRIFRRPWVKRTGANFWTNLFSCRVSCSRCSGHNAS